MFRIRVNDETGEMKIESNIFDGYIPRLGYALIEFTRQNGKIELKMQKFKNNQNT